MKPHMGHQTDAQRDRPTKSSESVESVTEGPWNVQVSRKDFVPLNQGGGDKVTVWGGRAGAVRRVCTATLQHDLSETKANARLIAAAPDLLAALLYYRDECSGYEPSISLFHRKMDEAIAKATGIQK